MTFAIILFCISFAGIITMLIMQLMNIRKGVVSLPKDSTPQHITVAHVKKTAWYTARAIMHIVIMQFIRGWAYVSHFFAKNGKSGLDIIQQKRIQIKPHKKNHFFSTVLENIK